MKRILEAPVYTGYYYQDIHISSVDGRTDSFIITVNHNNINNDIIARVYMRDNQWYIWYEKAGYRMTIPSFTEACSLLEMEIVKCVA